MQPDPIRSISGDPGLQEEANLASLCEQLGFVLEGLPMLK